MLLGVFFAQLPASIAQIRANLTGESAGPTDDSKVDWAAAFAEVRRLILDKHIDKPSDELLLKGAIQGMTEALNDPYTEFVPPSEKAAFEKDLTGQFVGIGATIIIRDGFLTIVYPLEDSPAYAAGLIPDDKVVSINGTSTKGLSVEQCVKQLLGEPDTLVNLEIERQAGEVAGTPKIFDVKLRRQAISATSVKGFRWDGAAEAAGGGRVGGVGGGRVGAPARSIGGPRRNRVCPAHPVHARCGTRVSSRCAASGSKRYDAVGADP